MKLGLAPAIRKTFQCLTDAVMDSMYFSVDEVNNIMRSAISLQYDIIVRPRVKLFELLYQHSDICTKQDAVVVLSGFGQNRPFILSLIAEIDYWPTARLKKDDLEELALEVEQTVYREAPITGITREVTALMEFETSIWASPRSEIRSDVLFGMFEERNLQFFCSGLQDETGKQVWSTSEIESALERTLLIGAINSDANGNSLHNGYNENSIRATLLEIEQSQYAFVDKIQGVEAGQAMQIASSVNTAHSQKSFQSPN